MFTAQSKDAVIKQARKLRNRYGDAQAICDAKDIYVEKCSLPPGVYGMHFKRHRIHLIYLEEDRHPYDVNFTLGHELAHAVLDDNNRFYIHDHSSKTYTERRADLFSAALILPDEIPYDEREYSTHQLANLYGVPEWTIKEIWS